jgi:hypothetical protein
MAKADYICCDKCNCKIIYDGHWNARNVWGDNESDWPGIFCSQCEKARKVELTGLRERAEKAEAALRGIRQGSAWRWYFSVAGNVSHADMQQVISEVKRKVDAALKQEAQP